MNLTQREADTLHALLYEIRKRANQKTRRHAIENLCDKAAMLLKKADQRRQRTTRLKFETGDFD